MVKRGGSSELDVVKLDVVHVVGVVKLDALGHRLVVRDDVGEVRLLRLGTAALNARGARRKEVVNEHSNISIALNLVECRQF